MEHTPTWLIHSFIYLSAAVIAVPISKALGLGSIIGYLAAGLAIGPWGLGLVTDVHAILQFAEFGVVLMLFLVGLELEPQRLWSLRRPIFGWGSAQVLLCAAALFAGFYSLGHWLPSLAGWRFAVVAALGLTMSSTAIAMSVMKDRNLLPTRSGQAGFSMLLFQDVAAIPILALLPLLAIARGATTEAVDLAEIASDATLIIGSIGGLILGGRLLLRPLFRWIAKSDTPEIFTAAALLLVVGIAALMQYVGLSMALGAFLAGVLLAESEYRRELETDIEPFKGLLLGLFFIAVGMSIDVGAIAKSPGLMALMVLMFMALKAIVIYILGRTMQLPVPERPVFTLLLAQGGEFAFVVFQAAADNRVIPGASASLLIGAVAISMAFSPLVLLLIDRVLLPQYAKHHRKEAEEISEPQTAPIVLVGLGRYGQIIARLMGAKGYNCTVLDHDVEMIEAARRFGYRVFYGDATRLDLLRIAGAGSARILVIAIDNKDQCLKIVDMAKEHFPNLQIVARARDVTHWHELRDRGVMLVQRELFESSLTSGADVLQLLGHDEGDIATTVQRFRDHNLALFEESHPHYKDTAKLIAVAKQGRLQLEQQMARERGQIQ